MFSRLLKAFRNSFASARPVPHKCRLGIESLEDRTVPATVYALIANQNLLRFDSANPADTELISVSDMGGEFLRAIDFRPRTGELFGTSVKSGFAPGFIVLTTYTINPLNGVATLVGATADTPGNIGYNLGYDFNPTVDRIRVVSSDDNNLRLNPINGAIAGTDTELSAEAHIIAEAYDRNFDRQTIASPANNALPSTLFAINRNTHQLARQGGVDGSPSPNGGAITDLGSLGIALTPNEEAGFDIAPDPTVSAALNNNGQGRALAALSDDTDDLTRLYDINLSTGAATPIGLIGTGSFEVFGLAIVPASTIAVGAGSAGTARLLNPQNNGAVRQHIAPFAGFVGGIRATMGDTTGDGIADLALTAIAPNGHVKVFNGATGAETMSFLAFAGFAGTVNVGTGDVNADGFDDVLVGANAANGHVKAFSGRDGALLASFFSFPGFLGNVSVSAGDFDLDGDAEILVTASSNGHTKIFSTNGFLFVGVPGLQNNFLAFLGYFGDVSVAGGDVNKDGRADIVFSSGLGTPAHVKAFNGANSALLASFFAYAPTFTGGGSVGVSDFNKDGFGEIAVTPGAGLQADVSLFELGTLLGSFPAFPSFLGGVTVGGGRG